LAAVSLSIVLSCGDLRAQDLELVLLAPLGMICEDVDFSVVEQSAFKDQNMPEGLIRRAGWGARFPKGDMVFDRNYKTIVVHHTQTPSVLGYRGGESVRAIQDYHMDKNKWSDIGYHYLVGPEGKYYEGRAEGLLGSHCPPNEGRLGLNLIGDFSKGRDTLGTVQRRKLVELLKYFCAKYCIRTEEIKGHRDLDPSDCPGDNVYNLLPQIRRQVCGPL